MKVLRLRSHYGVPALKGENSWGAEDPGTDLRVLPNGHFVVSKYNKHVLLPGAAVVSADVEPGDILNASMVANAISKGERRGEAGREPPIFVSPEAFEALKNDQTLPVSDAIEANPKRRAGRPNKEQPT